MVANPVPLRVAAKFKDLLHLEPCAEPPLIPSRTASAPDELRQRFDLAQSFWPAPLGHPSARFLVGRSVPSETAREMEPTEPLVVAVHRLKDKHAHLDDLLWLDGPELRPIEGLKRKKGRLFGGSLYRGVDWEPRGHRLLVHRSPSWIHVADMSRPAPCFMRFFVPTIEDGNLEGGRWLADGCVAVSCVASLNIVSVEGGEPKILERRKKRRGFALAICDGRVVVAPGEILAWTGGQLTKLATIKAKQSLSIGFDSCRCSFFALDRLVFHCTDLDSGLREYFVLTGMREALLVL
jgi:hypothetical protein